MLNLTYYLRDLLSDSALTDLSSLQNALGMSASGGAAGECLIQRYASETIDGVSASYDLASQESVALISNGTNWFSVAG